jgi:mannose-6-phosphate isomerase-like protein (cupin superfamily)
VRAFTNRRAGNVEWMQYTRRISAADAVDAGYPGYQVVMVAGAESATVLAGFLGNGGHPPLHTHDVDLFFVVLEGSTTIRLGHDSRQVQAGEVIYIPAGLPHGSDNQSGAAERHLEILIPGVSPGSPFLRPVRSVDEVQLPAAAPHVAISSGPATEVTGHETRWVLTDQSTGGRTARITAVERTGPEDPGSPASRDDDRLLVVTRGELAAEIAARPAAVPAQAVVVIPAGVPHRIWNSSSTPVRYLDADVPVPKAYAKLAPDQ